MRQMFCRRRLLVPPPRRLIIPSPPPPVDIPADVTVTGRDALLAALSAAPSNLGRDFVIRPGAGPAYGYLNLSGYGRGNTRVRLVGARASRPVFTGFNAPNASSLSLENLDVLGTERDAFGFPAGSPSSARGVILQQSSNCRVWECRIEDMAFGIEGNGSVNLEIGWNTIRAFAVDGIRIYQLTGVLVVGAFIHHNVVDANALTPKFPNLATLGLHYALPPTCAIDPRRSDQAGYGNVSSYVQPETGAPILVTADTKLGRHPDCIQLSGQSIGVRIEDNDLITSNLYCHGIFTDNGPSGAAELTFGLIIQRNRFLTAHVNAICAEGWDSTCRVEDCLIRAQPVRTWALGMPGGAADNPDLMRPSISVRKNTDALVRIVNTVCPAEVSTYWMQPSRISATGLVYSDTEVPVGWAAMDVAQGRVGHLQAP